MKTSKLDKQHDVSVHQQDGTFVKKRTLVCLARISHSRLQQLNSFLVVQKSCRVILESSWTDHLMRALVYLQ